MVISPPVLLRMRNVSGKIRRENKACTLYQWFFFQKIYRDWDNLKKKYIRGGQVGNEFLAHSQFLFDT